MDWDEFDKFDDIISKYMPSTGEGETMASQIVTAVNKIVYKWYNDGDVYDNTCYMDGWVNDISSFANWLHEYAPNCNVVLSKIYNCKSDDDYELLLYELASLTLNENYLAKFTKNEKCGTIYDCKGPFTFAYNDNDQEDDW